MQALPIGKARVLKEGRQVAFLAFGSMVQPARLAADALGATLIDMRFVKPLDEAVILEMAARHALLVTVEENAIMGGAGSGVSELLAMHGLAMPVLHLGLPDEFVEHGKPSELLHEVGLDADGILAQVKARLHLLARTVPALGIL